MTQPKQFDAADRDMFCLAGPSPISCGLYSRRAGRPWPIAQAWMAPRGCH